MIRRLLDHCEQQRLLLSRQWFGKQSQDWSSRCDVVVHPTSARYRQSTGLEARFSAGFSDVVVDGERVATRRIEVNGEEERRMVAVIDHELTHVVLADSFLSRRLPRWADEGIAVQSEPAHKKELRWNDLRPAVQMGEHIPLEQLFQLEEYPANRLALFYGQSASIVQFLVELGGEATLIQFLKQSQAEGYLPALNRHYRFADYAELEARWCEREQRRLAGAQVAAN